MPTERELRDVLARHPALLAGLPEHTDEVIRIAGRILDLEANPPTPPVLPPYAPAWEHQHWALKAESLPPPLIGDHGYLDLLDRARDADQLTDAQRRQQRLLHFAVFRSRNVPHLPVSDPKEDEWRAG